MSPELVGASRGIPRPPDMGGNLGTAKVSEPRRRGVGASSAAAERRKIIGVKKSTLSEKPAKGSYLGIDIRRQR